VQEAEERLGEQAIVWQKTEQELVKGWECAWLRQKDNLWHEFPSQIEGKGKSRGTSNAEV
jgi:hypothetical protein